MTPVQTLMDGVEWVKNESAAPGPDGLPFSTHSGVLRIGELTLRCHRLNDGRAILDADDVRAAFGGICDFT